MTIVEKCQKLIGQAKSKQAIEEALIYLKERNLNDLYDSVLQFKANITNVEKQNNIGIINQSEYNQSIAKINFGLLNVLGQIKEDVPTVFISYNHRDSEMAQKIKKELITNGIDVTLDVESMPAGEDITTFILNSVKNTKITLSIVSRNSLLSAWVAMESILTIKGDKKFIPCYISDEFLSNTFADDALDEIDLKISELNAAIEKRKSRNHPTADLDSEMPRWTELQNNIDLLIDKLRNSNCIDLRGDKFNAGIKRVIEAINN